MKRKWMVFLTMFFILVIIIACSKQDDFPILKVPYLGQKSPGMKPEVFAPGIISTEHSEMCSVFTPDAKLFLFNRRLPGEPSRMYITEMKEGVWTEPILAPFSREYNPWDYSVAADGRTIFFTSSVPTVIGGKTTSRGKTWKTQITPSGWTQPLLLEYPVNTAESYDQYASATEDETLYFFSGREGGLGLADIYRAELADGEYKEVENLGEAVNTEYADYDLYVAPDGSFLIFSSDRPGGYGEGDMYIAYRKKDGSWTRPANLGKDINETAGICPYVTFDRKYFFFSTQGDIYWADAGFINDIKKKVMNKAMAADVIQKEYREKGLQPAIDILKEMYSDEQEKYNFSLYELLSVCEEMIESGKVEKAERFCEALIDTLSEDFRIKLGYAIVCTMNGLTKRGLFLMKKLSIEFPDFDLEAHVFLYGYRFLSSSRIERAIEVFQFNIQEFPDSYENYYWLARAYERHGNIEKAVESCKKAIELKSDYSSAVELLKRLEKR